MPDGGSAGHPLRIVIVGGGFGGLAAARELGGADAEVTLIDRWNHHLFQPLLYQVATAALSPGDVAQPIRSVFRHDENIRVAMDEVTGVDLDARAVSTRRGSYPFDRLVLATGSADDYFGHPEWGEYVFGLKSLQDAVDIRHRVLSALERAEASSDPEERARLMTIAVVGGGPTGVELAGALAELTRRAVADDFDNIDPRATRIVLLEGGDALLSGFSDRLRAFARRALTRLGVEVRLGAMVERIDAGGVIAGGERVEAETVIWAAGQRARMPLAKWLGVEEEKGGRIAVGPDLRVVSHPEVFVIGDAASCRDEGGRPLPGLAAVASQQGHYVGRVLAAEARGALLPGPFRYKDRGTLATIGRSAAVADFGRVRLAGRLAWWLWGVVHVYSLIGFRNRMAVLLNWLWYYATARRATRLIIPRAASRAPRP